MKPPFRSLALALYALWVLLPMAWILLAALRPSQEIFASPLAWPRHWTLENFDQAWALGGLVSSLLNTLWVTAWTTLFTVLLGAALAFALARFRLPGSLWMQAALATGLILPLQLVVLPLFFWLKQLGLLGSLSGLILVYTASGIPYAFLLLRSFFAQLPQDLYEAALLDGCTPRRAFWSIFLPLARPGLASVGLFTALSIYNEYFLAFILLAGEAEQGTRTLPLGLAHLTMVSQYHADFGQLYAGLILVMLPLLGFYLVTQKWLLSSD